MSLFQIAFLMLAAGACGGVLFAVLQGLRIAYPRWFGAGHGLLGLAGVGTLAWAVVHLPGATLASPAVWALGAFAAALLGGVTLFRWLSPQRRPLVLVLMHGGLALLGLYLLYPVAFAASSP